MFIEVPNPNGAVGRRIKRWTVGLLAACIAVQSASAAAQAADSWSSSIYLVNPADGDGLSPVHAILMPDGRVSLMGLRREPGNDLITDRRFFAIFHDPIPLGSPVPAQLEYAYENLPYEFSVPNEPSSPAGAATSAETEYAYQTDDILFCAGHVLTSDGRLILAGGERLITAFIDNGGELEPVFFYIFGLPYTMEYNPQEDLWTRDSYMLEPGELGIFGRWYPTVTRLADSRLLIHGGYDVQHVVEIVDGEIVDISQGTPNRSVELFYPDTYVRETVSTHAQTPEEMWNQDYTHTFVLPEPKDGEYELLLFGELGQPLYLSFDGPLSWDTGNPLRPLASPESPAFAGASSLMLPLRLNNEEWGYNNGSVMAVGGGDMSGPHQGFADIFDPGANAWWDHRIALTTERDHPSTVLLPDATIAVVGGHNDREDQDPLMHCEYIDPAAGFSVSQGSSIMSTTRGYHTTALLLPDGRILVAGGRLGGTMGSKNEQPTLEYLYPPYMDQPRPTLSSAPGEIFHGQGFNVEWQGATTPEFVLMSLGSMTHSFDSSQRYVQLAVSSLDSAAGSATVTAPPNGRTAPPGHYMLFVVNEQRVPSVAKIIHLDEPAPSPPVITRQPPLVQYFAAGSTANISLAAAGGQPISYVWYWYIPFLGVVPVSMDQTLALPGVQPWQTGAYFCLVYNDLGWDVSNISYLVVTQ